MRRFKKWNAIALAIAAALPGNTLASALMPEHILPASAVQISAVDHAHQHGCCPGMTSCATACAASASCASVQLLLPVSAVAELVPGRVVVPAAQTLQLPEGTASLPESPPPRA